MSRVVRRVAGEDGLNRLAVQVQGRRTIHDRFERRQLRFLRRHGRLVHVEFPHPIRGNIGRGVALLDQGLRLAALARRRFHRHAGGTRAVRFGPAAHVMLHTDAKPGPVGKIA